MARTRYTPEERNAALELYAEVGPAEASRRSGIARGTLQSWAHRAGVQSHATETTAVATEASLVALDARKAKLAADLMSDIERLRLQLFAPCTQRKVVITGEGKGYSSAEVVDVHLDQPVFADQRQIMTSLAIAVDKVQILTGEATERIDLRQINPIDEELQRLADQLEHQAVEHQPA